MAKRDKWEEEKRFPVTVAFGSPLEFFTICFLCSSGLSHVSSVQQLLWLFIL